MSAARTFPALLEAFFTDRLIRQRQASPHTLASYRDTFCLLLGYAQRQRRKAPTDITLEDLDTAFIGAFLDHLENQRDNSARSRNVRLAAIHSFFRYVALHSPEHSALAQRVLAMPSKRYIRRPVAFLNDTEVAALLAAPDLSKWSGRRDRALLLARLRGFACLQRYFRAAPRTAVPASRPMLFRDSSDGRSATLADGRSDWPTVGLAQPSV
jgi:integrase/recombinase XerD